MPKVMLVEDDNNLREIYDARLAAEGYEIVSAHDGEEALAMAVKEKPDLIISDIMMPKISGFDMLDILRSTPETKNTKVIMMTALSQAEDRERAGKLGADRYLIKSQVTLEDVIKVAHEVLNDTGAPKPAAPAPAASVPAASQTPMPVASPPAAPAPTPSPAPSQPAAPVPTPAPAAPTVPTPAPAPTPPPPAPTPPVEPPAPVMPVVAPPVDAPADTGTVPAPVPNPTPAPEETPKEDKPEAPEVTVSPDTPKPAEPATTSPTEAPTAPLIEPTLSQTEADEANGVEKQIQDFIANNPTLTSSATGEADKKPADETPGAPAVVTTPTTEAPTPPPAEPANEPVPSAEVLAPPPGAPTPPPTPTPQEALSNPTPLTNADGAGDSPAHRKLVLTPTKDALDPGVDLNALLDKEQQKVHADEPVETPETNAIITPTPTEPANADSSPKPSDIAL